MEFIIFAIVGLAVGIAGALIMEQGVSPTVPPSERLGFFSQITWSLAGSFVVGYLFSTTGITGSYPGWILTALLGSVVPLFVVDIFAWVGRGRAARTSL